jgi:hypothetical protein
MQQGGLFFFKRLPGFKIDVEFCVAHTLFSGPLVASFAREAGELPCRRNLFYQFDGVDDLPNFYVLWRDWSSIFSFTWEGTTVRGNSVGFPRAPVIRSVPPLGLVLRRRCPGQPQGKQCKYSVAQLQLVFPRLPKSGSSVPASLWPYSQCLGRQTPAPHRSGCRSQSSLPRNYCEARRSLSPPKDHERITTLVQSS